MAKQTAEQFHSDRKKAIIEQVSAHNPNNVTFVGLDKSLTSTGICHIYPDGSIVQDEISVNGYGIARITAIGKRILAHISPLNNPFVCMEGYAFDRMNRSHELGELGGIIKLFLDTRKIPWLEVPPTTLKKFVTGKGNTKKNLMPMHVIKRFGFEPVGGDAADAIGCAFLGKRAFRHIAGQFKGTTYEMEAIASFLSLEKKKRKKSTNKKNKELAAQIDG